MAGRGASVLEKVDDEGVEAVAAAAAAEDGARVFHSLTVQSSELVSTRSLRSRGPRAG